MSVQLLLIQIANGIGLGLLYFMLAAGLTIVFGLMGFVNLAHGAFYLVAAYATYAIAGFTGSMWWALALAPLVTAAIAIVGEQVLLARTYRLSHDTQILVTLAIAIVLQEAVILFFGPFALNVAPPEMLAGHIAIGMATYPVFRVAIVVVALACCLGMWALIDRTHFGALLRAGAEDHQMLGALGIDVNRLWTFAFALGALLAGLAGALAAPLRGLDPAMGHEALALAFVVVVLGGLGTLWGALIAALLIGLLQSIMSSLWPGGAYLMVYAAMVLVLLVRPRGLLGRG